MGSAMAYHGYPKVFGGVAAQLAQGLSAMGFPAPTLFAWLASLSEFGGGLLIVLGLGTRVAATFVFINMSVALFVAHAKDPFQVKELAFLFWTISGALIATGGGKFSLDSLFCGKCCHKSCDAAAK